VLPLSFFCIAVAKHKTQKRETARSAVSLFWVLICPNASGYSYLFLAIAFDIKTNLSDYRQAK